MKIKLLLAILALAVLAGTASADTQTWTYTGNSVSGPSQGQNPLPPNPCGCALDGTITFASPMTGLTQTQQDVLSYSFTDGAYTFNQANSTLGFSAFTAANQPSFEEWFLEVTALDGTLAFFSEGYDTYEATDSGIGGLYVQGNQGTWTDSVATPEPGTLALLAVGLGLLLFKRTS
jgi:hypothetical protein